MNFNNFIQWLKVEITIKSKMFNSEQNCLQFQSILWRYM